MIVRSGHGVHAYWISKEAIVLGENRETDYERGQRCVEVVMRPRWWRYEGDASSSVDAHGRQPQHQGDSWLDVVIVDQDDIRRYELDEIEDMLSIKSPIILRKERPPQEPNTEDRYWENYYNSLNIKRRRSMSSTS